MRMDKLTSRFQQALSDAQSLAVGRDHNLIEPAHLLLALLDQKGGGTRPLLAQAGVNVTALRQRLAEALDKLPTVTGQAGSVSLGNDLSRLLNVADKLAQQREQQVRGLDQVVVAAHGERLRVAERLLEARGELVHAHGILRNRFAACAALSGRCGLGVMIQVNARSCILSPPGERDRRTAPA